MVFLQRLRDQSVTVFPGSLRDLQGLQSAGLHVAVVSSSKNTSDVLEAARLRDSSTRKWMASPPRARGSAPSRRLTRTSRRRKPGTCRRPSPPCSTMPWPASKQARRGTLGGSLASIALGTARQALLRHGADVVVAY